jgi:hypothetical protein
MYLNAKEARIRMITTGVMLGKHKTMLVMILLKLILLVFSYYWYIGIAIFKSK